MIERDGHFCLLALNHCQGEASTTDHRANRGVGGARVLNHPANLIAACERCNGDKADAHSMTLIDLEERGLYIRPDATHEKTLRRALTTPVVDLQGRWWFLIDENTRMVTSAPAGGVL